MGKQVGKSDPARLEIQKGVLIKIKMGTGGGLMQKASCCKACRKQYVSLFVRDRIEQFI
jgi:hypothetical protein